MSILSSSSPLPLSSPHGQIKYYHDTNCLPFSSSAKTNRCRSSVQIQNSQSVMITDPGLNFSKRECVFASNPRTVIRSCRVHTAQQHINCPWSTLTSELIALSPFISLRVERWPLADHNLQSRSILGPFSSTSRNRSHNVTQFHLLHFLSP